METTLDFGCRWVLGKLRKGKDTVSVHCGKTRQDGKQYCPKHQLSSELAPGEKEQRQQKLAKLQEYREAQRAALAESPLAAVADAGCEWVTGGVQCNKLRERGTSFCPKHNLFAHERGEHLRDIG
jgi:hypothetical protein